MKGISGKLERGKLISPWIEPETSAKTKTLALTCCNNLI